MIHAFRDRQELPVNQYGSGKEFMIDDEDLAQDIQLHLQGRGKYIKAYDIVRYLDTPDMLARLGRKKTISERTARNWMKKMGYRWTKDPKGQYVDGHERSDVVAHRQTIFLPAWSRIAPKLQKRPPRQNCTTLPDMHDNAKIVSIPAETTDSGRFGPENMAPDVSLFTVQITECSRQCYNLTTREENKDGCTLKHYMRCR